MERYDVVIIGAGVIGSAIARELSRNKGDFLVLERAPDVCEGTSKANSAIIHAGFDAEPGTWKAKMNVKGNQMMDRIARELDVPFKRIGALVVCLAREDMPRLEELYRRGIENGVADLCLLSGEEARAIEPHLTGQVCGALLAGSSGIVCPFELTLGFAENAARNGVEFRFDTEVTGVERKDGYWLLRTSRGNVEARAVVNAAGVYADRLHNQVCEDKLNITARRGEYMLLDKTAGGHVAHTVFQMPGKYGKGVLVSPTVHGNLLMGPTAADIEEKENTATTRAGLDEVAKRSALAVENLPLRQVITSFAGLRAHEEKDDFVLGEAAECFFDAAGVESPGLSSAPAIGEYLAGMAAQKLGLEKTPLFDPVRKAVVRLADLPWEQRAEKIKENPAYGAIVCRCEQVSEGEILDAVHSTLGARTLDGVKRRTRAGMGRCQGGFCSPRVMEILSREWRMDLTEVRKSGGRSQIVLEKTRKEEQP